MASSKISPKFERDEELGPKSKNSFTTDGDSSKNSDDEICKTSGVTDGFGKEEVVVKPAINLNTKNRGEFDPASETLLTTGDSSSSTSDEHKISDSDLKINNVEETTDDEIEDETDGSFITKLVDGHDDTLSHPHRKVQLFSCNQQPGEREGYFLKMVVDKSELTGFRVTTTGVQTDPHAVWIARYTVDDQRRQTLVFINEKCSTDTGQTCVLSTLKVSKTDYLLTGKELNEAPVRMTDIDPAYGFFKFPKAIGSELLFLKSMLTTKEDPLLVGFDAAGEPLPLNKVKKYANDFQAFFKIIPGEFIDE